jgi:pimeloyl-ACP methyl ester carboxylesterase
MPFQHTTTSLGPAPAVLVYQESPEPAARAGTVIFFHGLGASKETHLEDLEALAARGFLAVGLDNLGHGERPPTAEQMGLVARLGWQGAFLEAIRRTASEVPAILDALTARFGARRFGIAGVSMGGYITYASVLLDRRLTVAAPILGSPFWEGASDSPHRQASLYFPVALLAQNAGQDSTVPPRFARAFHQELLPHYAAAPDRLEYVEYPHSGHFMRPQDFVAVRARAVAWFERFLGESTGR